MRLRLFDFAAIVVAAAAVAAASVAAYAPGSGEPNAIVSGDGGQWIYPLSSDAEFSVAGPLGSTQIEVRDGAVRVLDSPCSNKTCISAGSVSKPGQWIACLPNKVFVRVEGGRADDGVDAATY
ncbi:MAG: NusG domain II-containing protein [Spirochaetaceae bacterium]|nr:NusG domain II-containing protein [Spirochaetaceae bacterium]